MRKSPARRKTQSTTARPVRVPRASVRRPVTVSFPVVGLGASAGGLEAVTQLLESLPAEAGVAFVLIQHLDPTHESALTAILSRSTRMPVTEARHGMRVERDHVYVIPPNKLMGIAHRTLELQPRGRDGGVATPVDFFFRALAQDQGNRAIGVVLSGTGTDGTQGLEEIKAAGGITFAQSEQSAKYAGMPGSAIAAACADFILPPQKIAVELARIGRHPYIAPACFAKPPAGVLHGDKDFDQVCAMLRAQSGVDFSQYKPTTLARRMARRMVLLKLDTLAAYVMHLRQNPTEVEALFQDILISVTRFFRDPKLFDVLKRRIFPKILKEKTGEQSIRIWVPGCSTGEEVYSLAIALLEFLQKAGVHFPVQLFGTDINESSLARARAGVYPHSVKGQIPAERLRRFFTKTPTGYRINKSVRDLCIFARQNIVQDPPFSHLDLISCRNVLIYFDATLQRRAMPVFHYALQSHGFLLLGTAESVGSHVNLFGLVNAPFKIYAKKIAHSRAVHVTGFGHDPERKEPGRRLVSPASVETVLGGVRKQADGIILSHFAPSGVVINAGLEVLQFRGHTGGYLEHSPGEANLNLLRMARPGLAVELRALISRAARQKGPVRKRDVEIHPNGSPVRVSVEVIPFLAPPATEQFFLVLFEPDAAVAPPPRPQGRARRATAPSGELAELQRELAATKQSLQSIIDEQETAVEEMRAANEEILSSNEELQSTNEELETAKEELQSTNEELTTLNDELQSRNAELQQLGDDLMNVFAGTDIPLVMLGSDLRIRRFTPRAEKVLNLISGDVGRPITDLKTSFDLPDLEPLITEVLETLGMQEREIQDRSGHWFVLRVRPYRTTDNRIDGVILTLQDIDVARRSLEAAEQARQLAEAIVDTVREPLLLLDGELRVKRANQSFYRTFQVTPTQTNGKFIYELGSGQWDIPQLRELLERILPANTTINDHIVEHNFPGVGHKTMRLNARRVLRAKGRAQFILLAIEELTSPAKDTP